VRIPTITVLLLLVWQPGTIGQSTGATTPAACATLKQLQVPGVALTVTKTEWIAAGTTPPTGPGAPPSATTLPAYCRLDGVIDRRAELAGATYGIGFGLALPESWNGRFLFKVAAA
jgi:feruloyl esterase